MKTEKENEPAIQTLPAVRTGPVMPRPLEVVKFDEHIEVIQPSIAPEPTENQVAFRQVQQNVVRPSRSRARTAVNRAAILVIQPSPAAIRVIQPAREPTENQAVRQVQVFERQARSASARAASPTPAQSPAPGIQRHTP